MNQLERGKMKARVFLCIGSVCILMMVAGCFQVNPLPNAVDYNVTVDEIVSEFHEDEFAATAKYDNKTIAISGYVTNKDISDSGKPWVGLKEGPGEFDSLVRYGVICSFPRSSLSELVSVQKGDHLTIIGEFERYGVSVAVIIVQYIVKLENCRFP